MTLLARIAAARHSRQNSINRRSLSHVAATCRVSQRFFDSINRALLCNCIYANNTFMGYSIHYDSPNWAIIKSRWNSSFRSAFFFASTLANDFASDWHQSSSSVGSLSILDDLAPSMMDLATVRSWTSVSSLARLLFRGGQLVFASAFKISISG